VCVTLHSSGSIELLQSGRVSADHWDWALGAAFRWGIVSEWQGWVRVETTGLEGTNLDVICMASPEGRGGRARGIERIQTKPILLIKEEEEGSDAQQAAAPKPPGGKLALATGSHEPPKGDKGSTPSSGSTPPSANASVAGGLASVAVVGAEVSLPMIPRLPTASASAAADCDGASLAIGWGRGLRSADDLKTPFSNFTSGYKALLDYVWIDPEKIEVGGGLGGGPLASDLVRTSSASICSQKLP